MHVHNISQFSNSVLSQQNQHPMYTGHCTLCQRVAVCVCQRCGDFYCSTECQRRDWQRHRYICMPIPALIHASAFFDSTLLERAQAHHNPAPVLVGPPLQNPSVAVQKLTVPPAKNLNKVSAIGHENKMNSLPENQHHNKSAPNHNKYNTGAKPDNREPIVLPNRNVPKNAEVVKPKNGGLSLPKPEFPKSNARVTISGFRSANRCNVRVLTPAVNDAYFQIIEMINNYGKNAPQLKKTPRMNSHAITKRDGAFHRVRILSNRNGKSFRVIFVDYGFVDLRKFEELLEICYDIEKLPHYSMVIQLQGILNYANNVEINKFLSKFEGIEYKIVYGKTDSSGQKMELYNWQTDSHLNEEIRTFCSKMRIYEIDNSSMCSKVSDSVSIIPDALAKEQIKTKQETPEQIALVDKVSEIILNEESLKKHNEALNNTPPPKSALLENLQLALKQGSTQLEPVLKAPFSNKQLPITDDGLNLFIVDNSNLTHGYLGCIAVKDACHLAIIQDYLLKFNDNKPYTPVLHEYVIARFDGDWFRGKVLSLTEQNGETKYTVIYIDFTNESILTSKDIRRYPADLTFDCYTSFCMIIDLPTVLETVHFEFLKRKLNNNTSLFVNSISYPNEHLACIKCDDLITEMKASL